MMALISASTSLPPDSFTVTLADFEVFHAESVPGRLRGFYHGFDRALSPQN
jgi:hypothetical protein